MVALIEAQDFFVHCGVKIPVAYKTKSLDVDALYTPKVNIPVTKRCALYLYENRSFRCLHMRTDSKEGT